MMVTYCWNTRCSSRKPGFSAKEQLLSGQFTSSAPMEIEGPTPAAPGLWRRLVIGRNPKRTLARTFIWALGCILIGKFVLLPSRVKGISMMPTYKQDKVNFVNRLAYCFHPPRRGDIVAIKLAGPHVM